jgi:site-specific recombinase XerD
LWLSERGYSRWTIAHRLWQLDLLSRWLEREGLSPDELTRERVVEFLAARRAGGYSTWLSVRSTALPLEYLRELGGGAGRAGTSGGRRSDRAAAG